MNPGEIRTALADAFKDLPINAYAYGPGARTPPFVLIRSADDYLTFHETWHRAGVQTVRFRLEVVASGRPEDAERLMDELVTYGEDETKSLFEVLKADRTLGGVVSNLKLVGVSGVTESEYGWSTSLLLDIQPLP